MVLILDNDWENSIPSISTKMGFFRRVHDATLRDKVLSCEISRPQCWATSLQIERSQPHVGWAMWPKCPRNECRGKFAGCSHGKATQTPSKDQVEWLHLRRCLFPSWREASRTIWDCCWPWSTVFRVLLGLLSLQPFPEERRAWNWMEFSEVLCCYLARFISLAGRAGLKPMQPMQLHWAPSIRGSRAMVFGHVVHFRQILLALANSVKPAYKSHC